MNDRNIMRVENQDIVTDDIFETVIEYFPDIVHSVDAEGQIVFTNRTAIKLLGYTREEILGMNMRELYAPEVLDQLEEGFTTLQLEGEKLVESVVRTKEGEDIPVEIRSFSIYDRDGNFLRTVSILRDIRKIKDLQESLVHAARLVAIGEMASGIVHDINNPLSVISLSNQMIVRALEDKDISTLPPELTDVLENAESVTRAADSIARLVSHLKNFARGVSEGPEHIDIAQSIKDALFLVSSKVKQLHVKVELNVESETYYTRAAANKLEQVFSNLVSNACDAMAGRETRELTIGVEPCVRDSAYYWKCSVSDTGEGIPYDIQHQVFESFYTTKDKDHGTGLGLSIVRGIVKNARGVIEVVSTPGHGTTFTVYLPQVAQNGDTLSSNLLLMTGTD